jgi:hypothetical protein
MHSLIWLVLVGFGTGLFAGIVVGVSDFIFGFLSDLQKISTMELAIIGLVITVIGVVFFIFILRQFKDINY